MQIPAQHAFVALALAAIAPMFASGQEAAGAIDETPSKHVLWIIPNFRTSPDLKGYEPLTTKEKFTIATQDTFDRGTIALAALFAGQSQLSNSDQSFGHGIEGYTHRWAASYADFAIGNYMTEGVYPALLHQDPRYFRRGTGSFWGRLGYAVRQIVWTRTDSGGSQFNYSEIVGNSTAVAISMAYRPDSRTAPDALSMVATQIGVDTAANIVKEFWPGRVPWKRQKGGGE